METLSDTRRVIVIGKNSLGFIIKADIARALKLEQGSLVEVTIRNTGTKLEPTNRGQNGKKASTVVEP